MSPVLPLPDLSALTDRWQRQALFVLLDLEFDGGRRLLAAAAALLHNPAAPQCLHYVVLGDLPFDTALIAAMASESDPSMASLCGELHNAWLPAVPGFQRLVFADGRLVLTVVAGPPAIGLPQLTLAFDACYCRIADLSENAIRWLGRLAAVRALLFFEEPIDSRNMVETSLIDMLQNLGQAGFIEAAADRHIPTRRRMLQFQPRHHMRRSAALSTTSYSPGVTPEKHAIVVGAGLAGAAACHRLSLRGWRCTLIEQHAAPAQQASGNAAGIFMPVLSQDDNPLSRLTRAAYLFALHVWDGLGGIGDALPGQACGVLQLARSDAGAGPVLDRGLVTPWPYPSDFARWMDSAQAGALLGQAVAGGWWFAAAGWLHPAAVCEAMLKACGDRLQILYRRQALQLTHDGSLWHVMDADGLTIASAPVAILANGAQAGQLMQAAGLPLQAIRGQVTQLPASTADLPVVLCGDAYLTPAAYGFASLGATYDADLDPALRPESHRQNLQRLQQMLPDWLSPDDPAALDGRVGFRCVAPDRLPLVGALPDSEPNSALANQAGNGDMRLQDMPRLPGLYGLLAYGSRGLIWSPLAAELLAAQLNGEPLPLPRDLVALLDPARFALKQRRRGS